MDIWNKSTMIIIPQANLISERMHKTVNDNLKVRCHTGPPNDLGTWSWNGRTNNWQCYCICCPFSSVLCLHNNTNFAWRSIIWKRYAGGCPIGCKPRINLTTKAIGGEWKPWRENAKRCEYHNRVEDYVDIRTEFRTKLSSHLHGPYYC